MQDTLQMFNSLEVKSLDEAIQQLTSRTYRSPPRHQNKLLATARKEEIEQFNRTHRLEQNKFLTMAYQNQSLQATQQTMPNGEQYPQVILDVDKN